MPLRKPSRLVMWLCTPVRPTTGNHALKLGRFARIWTIDPSYIIKTILRYLREDVNFIVDNGKICRKFQKPSIEQALVLCNDHHTDIVYGHQIELMDLVVPNLHRFEVSYQCKYSVRCLMVDERVDFLKITTMRCTLCGFTYYVPIEHKIARSLRNVLTCKYAVRLMCFLNRADEGVLRTVKRISIDCSVGRKTGSGQKVDYGNSDLGVFLPFGTVKNRYTSLRHNDAPALPAYVRWEGLCITDGLPTELLQASNSLFQHSRLKSRLADLRGFRKTQPLKFQDCRMLLRSLLSVHCLLLASTIRPDNPRGHCFHYLLEQILCGHEHVRRNRCYSNIIHHMVQCGYDEMKSRPLSLILTSLDLLTQFDLSRLLVDWVSIPIGFFDRIGLPMLTTNYRNWKILSRSVMETTHATTNALLYLSDTSVGRGDSRTVAMGKCDHRSSTVPHSSKPLLISRSDHGVQYKWREEGKTEKLGIKLKKAKNRPVPKRDKNMLKEYQNNGRAMAIRPGNWTTYSEKKTAPERYPSDAVQTKAYWIVVNVNQCDPSKTCIRLAS
ncbi:hypothetical protein CLF_104381 [Clonorchis sinensis]|uniref:Uncharacterized protein n=1 Tax=Clonorchis sinensis TaxID=79923 RepID=G7YBJ6_CLOSI|nr:hypothetical protein CLF_104381 [Clonorchis sinensis]